MRYRVKSVGVLLLIGIYCLAISLVNQVPFGPELQTQSGNQRDYFSTVKAAFHYHGATSETTVKAPANFSFTGFNQVFSGAGPTSFAINQLFESRFVHYKTLTKRFLIQVRKADLIFPFHYFW